MTKAYVVLRNQLELFDGLTKIEVSEAKKNVEDGGVLPAALMLSFSANALGMHTLEFIVWAFSDIRRAGARVHVQPTSPPPWLNAPGKCLRLNVYINPREEKAETDNALKELAIELEGIANFFDQVHKKYWPLCKPWPLGALGRDA